MSGGFLALQQKRTRERKKLVELEDAFKVKGSSFEGKNPRASDD